MKKNKSYEKNHKIFVNKKGGKMPVKIIYFVHGTTTDNEKHLSTGWNHGTLSKKGIKQAKELKKQINQKEIDLVISSDLKRAIDSAKIILGEKQTLHDKRIRECNYGDLNGKPAELVKYIDHITKPFPNGESLIDVENRIKDFINYLLENYNNKTIALVSHKAPQLALDVITKNITWETAINQDWRKTKAWQPGWTYEIKEKPITK